MQIIRNNRKRPKKINLIFLEPAFHLLLQKIQYFKNPIKTKTPLRIINLPGEIIINNSVNESEKVNKEVK